MNRRKADPLIDRARKELSKRWIAARKAVPASSVGKIPVCIAQATERCINSPTKSYRYVLPTQLLAKLVKKSLDCHSIQAGCGLEEAFDARSLCDQVVVPFDRANHDVLGGSTEPYANNPLRIPAILPAGRKAQRNQMGFDDLLLVLDYAQGDSSRVPELLEAVLAAIVRRLALVHITYPVPNRVSLKQTTAIIDCFLADRTGGLRLQAVAVALFKCIGDTFRLYCDVISSNVNAADASTGGSADLECRDKAKRIVLAVEVKDRQLTVRHVQDKLPAVREKEIRETIFLVRGGVETNEQAAVDGLIDREYSAGQNLYVGEFGDFLRVCLTLFGESPRRLFLRKIGEELDADKADLAHRQTWRDLLQDI